MTTTLLLDSTEVQNILSMLKVETGNKFTDENNAALYAKIWAQYRQDASGDGPEPIPAFREGIDSARDKLSRSRNPYPAQSYRAKRWDDGWRYFTNG